ncbi:MAG: hypothetical protein ACRCYK_15195, partial [Aeromonas hydrophila]
SSTHTIRPWLTPLWSGVGNVVRPQQRSVLTNMCAWIPKRHVCLGKKMFLFGKNFFWEKKSK